MRFAKCSPRTEAARFASRPQAARKRRAAIAHAAVPNSSSSSASPFAAALQSLGKAQQSGDVAGAQQLSRNCSRRCSRVDTLA
jgi:hypothetical protein